MTMARKLGTFVSWLALFGCVATNTGNPSITSSTGGPDAPGITSSIGGPHAPEGIERVRSSLERDIEPSVADTELGRFSADGRDFALDLYAQLAAADGNLFVSPYSVRVALSMTYAGAEGETEAEMRNALRFSLPEPDLYAAFNATDLALSNRSNELGVEQDFETSTREPATGDLELRVVNAAFTQKDVELKQPFLDTLAVHYDTGMFLADFFHRPEQERVAINQWVEEQTETRIQELLPADSIHIGTVLVLVNAVYFKGSWLEPFDPARTAEEIFHAPSGDVTVSMINGSAEQYTRGDGYQALELPYIAPAVRMLFILPDEGRFQEIEGALDRAAFDRIRDELRKYSVTIKVPKFSFDYQVRLREVMEALGMRRAFSEMDADFSDITTDLLLYVDAVFHKAFVALDEQGTEAAAATAVIMKDISLPPPAEFFLDRPFLFFIYDEPTGEILFAGRLVDPS